MENEDIDQIENEDQQDVDSDDSYDTEELTEELQTKFLEQVQGVMTEVGQKYPDAKAAITETARGIINIIEGENIDEGYVLMDRDSTEVAVCPIQSDPNHPDFDINQVAHEVRGLDISSGLLEMFDTINS